jgi:hypothetical protein
LCSVNFFYTWIATSFNECDKSSVFKYNTWCVGILLDVCVKLLYTDNVYKLNSFINKIHRLFNKKQRDIKNSIKHVIKCLLKHITWICIKNKELKINTEFFLKRYK